MKNYSEKLPDFKYIFLNKNENKNETKKSIHPNYVPNVNKYLSASRTLFVCKKNIKKQQTIFRID